MSGYVPQYRTAASVILRHLKDGTLKWVRLADPEAGRTDDFQVGRQSRVDGYQVKWSKFGGGFTFNDLVKGGPKSPSLVAQPAEGRKRLQSAHAGDRVVVHLVTNQVPSVSDRLHSDPSESMPRHFASFLTQAWRVFQASGSRADVPAIWAKAWETIRKQTGLSDSDFEHFVLDCDLEFGYRALDFAEARSREQQIVQDDLSQLAQFLEGVVAGKENLVELTRDKLIEGLGWRARLEFKSRHDFRVAEETYQPAFSMFPLGRAISPVPG